MIKKVLESRVDVLTQISEKISAMQSTAEMLSNLYYYNENLIENYHGDSYTKEEIEQIEENFTNIENLTGMTKEATGLEFYYTFLMENGYTYSSDPGKGGQSLADYKNKVWFPDVIEEKQKWISTYEDNQGENVVSIARSMVNEKGEFKGLFLFNIYEKSFKQIYENLVGENDIYLVDDSGNIVSHKNEELIGIHFYDMDILNQMFQEQNYSIVKKNQSKFENLLLILQGRNPESCSMYGICSRQLTVEADGSVYPCDFYAVDEWKLGNIAADTIESIEKKEQELHFVDQSRLLPDKCKKCRWYPLCRNGCRRNCEPVTSTGRQVNHYCQAYCDFFEYAYEGLIEVLERWAVK